MFDKKVKLWVSEELDECVVEGDSGQFYICPYYIYTDFAHFYGDGCPPCKASDRDGDLQPFLDAKEAGKYEEIILTEEENV